MQALTRVEVAFLPVPIAQMGSYATTQRAAQLAIRLVVQGVSSKLDAYARIYADVLRSAGFDAVVNERANDMTWPRGQMRYNLAILRELGVFRPIPYVIEVDGTRHETRAMLVAVAMLAATCNADGPSSCTGSAAGC